MLATGQVCWQWPWMVKWNDKQPPRVQMTLFAAGDRPSGSNLHLHELVDLPQGISASAFAALVTTAVSRFRLADDKRWSSMLCRDVGVRADLAALLQRDGRPATEKTVVEVPGALVYGALARLDLDDPARRLLLWNAAARSPLPFPDLRTQPLGPNTEPQQQTS